MLTGPKRSASQDRSDGHVATLLRVNVGACCMLEASHSVWRGSARGTAMPYARHVARRPPAKMWPNALSKRLCVELESYSVARCRCRRTACG